MDNTFLRRLLIDEEGCNLNGHQLKGVWHAGIGHNVEIQQTQEELEAMGPENARYIAEKRYDLISLIQEQADRLFDIDVQDALEDVQPAFMPDELEALGETRRAIILSMVFQMGGGGVRKFKNFIAQVKAKNWDRASLEMLYSDPDVRRESQWYIDTPARCQRAADAMRNGYFKEYTDAPTEAPIANVGVLANISDDQLMEELSRRIKKK